MPDVPNQWNRHDSDHKGVKAQFVVYDGKGFRIHFDSKGVGDNAQEASAPLKFSAICRAWTGKHHCSLNLRFTSLTFYPNSPKTPFSSIVPCCPD